MHESQEYSFAHEKLDVYREAIDFIAWLSALLESIVRAGDVKDHLGPHAHGIDQEKLDTRL